MAVGFNRRATHRHLHLELILIELEEDVGERPLQEGGGPQDQNQLEVAWEGALRGETGEASSSHCVLPLPAATYDTE